MKSNICVCTMTHNDIGLLPAYYRHIKNFAESWAVLDHGSTDGTLEFLKRMESRNEIEIAIEVDDTPFSKPQDFFDMYNSMFEKANKKWVWAGYSDEFLMDNAITDVFSIINSNMDYGYFFNVFDITCLNPLLYYICKPCMRMWKKELGFSWYAGSATTSHSESYETRGHKKVRCIGEIVHLSPVKNLDKMKENIRSFKKMGTSPIDDSTLEIDMINMKNVSRLYWDNSIFKMLI